VKELKTRRRKRETKKRKHSVLKVRLEPLKKYNLLGGASSEGIKYSHSGGKDRVQWKEKGGIAVSGLRHRRSANYKRGK